MGQTRVPGLVVFALIILLIGVFSLIYWYVEQTYGSPTTGIVWPFFGIAIAIVIIVVWSLTRTSRPR